MRAQDVRVEVRAKRLSRAELKPPWGGGLEIRPDYKGITTILIWWCSKINILYLEIRPDYKGITTAVLWQLNVVRSD